MTDEAVVFDSDLMDEVFDVPMDLGAESTLDSQAEKFAKEETKAPVVVIPQADAVAAYQNYLNHLVPYQRRRSR